MAEHNQPDQQSQIEFVEWARDDRLRQSIRFEIEDLPVIDDGEYRLSRQFVGNKKLESEGKVDKATGKVQAGYGDLKEDIKDAVKKP